MAKVIPTADGIPVVNLANSAPHHPTEAETKPLETAHDAVGPAPSRWWLRASAAWWRGLQTIGMTLHFIPAERPPSPSFTKTIPSTISKSKGEFTLQFYTPKGYNKAAKTGEEYPALVNFHGGGFFLGNATDDARFARFVLDKCNAVFVSVDYRLSPENPFPVAVEDAADALLYLIRNRARPPHRPLQNWQYLASQRAATSPSRRPCVWPTISGNSGLQASMSPNIAFTLPDNLTSLFDASYLHPPDLKLATPYLSPTKATDEQLAEALPETVIFYTCEWDMLLQEGEELAKRLKRAPISRDVRYKMIKGVPHAWDKSPDPTKPAEFSEDLYRECCEHLREVFEKP
ncbi:hypothetical protein NEMBOFW57_008024 [Staphylotrichum longicolle]|uniref:Alpha/beta hydrolase fold-3 domain-containing protein n=1 Tax=Staphylotrichum longicolle TaxID=669026 RepID=A0AAD4EQX8_9PEZI|nr:hypothetical protein NEMBOFW57_008024 [Staphylotrichum longicolle]